MNHMKLTTYERLGFSVTSSQTLCNTRAGKLEVGALQHLLLAKESNYKTNGYIYEKCYGPTDVSTICLMGGFVRPVTLMLSYCNSEA